MAVMENLEEPLNLYRTKKWDEAEKVFRELAENYPLDLLPTIYAERCLEMKKTPPLADWDGVQVFNQK